MVVHVIIMLILVLINLIPDRQDKRRKYILPLSFIIIAVYWSIRYDYGLDYWAYYYSFYSGEEGRGIDFFNEKWFYSFMHLFKYYFQFIIAQSLVIVISLFHFVRKYINSSYYWLFFLLLFAVCSLHFNYLSAMRTALAACIVYWAFDYCYISKKRWLLFLILVVVAAQFHTSALAFLSLPLLDYGLSRVSGFAIFILLIVFDILQMTYVGRIYSSLIGISEITQRYDFYSEKVLGSNINGFIMRSMILWPTFFICKSYSKIKKNYSIRCIYILAFTFLSITMIGLNFQGRFYVYLFPFYIMALIYTCLTFPRGTRILILVPYFLFVALDFVRYYQGLWANIMGTYSEGNPLFYHTIFSAPSLP